MRGPDLTSRRGILDPEAARRHFRLERFAPADDLARLVDRYWTVAWDLTEPYTQEIVSHPSVHLVFEPAATVYGVVTSRFRRELRGRGSVLGVKFRPGGFHPFRPAVHTLTDRALPAREVFGESPDAGIAEVEAFLRARMPAPDPNVELIDDLYAAILADPAITRVQHLGAHCGLSVRSLQRLFREYVGVSPKWVLQRVRLHEAAERMNEGRASWARLALDLGYFDQAHFIKDFKAVIGRSPAEYAAMTS